MPCGTDTICAPITGRDPAAVAIVRLSGPEAWGVARALFGGLPPAPETHRAYYGLYRNGDDGLATCFAPGHGYTGEESVELSVHGSPAAVRALVAACVEAGARMAEPGEFSLRAFMNGRIDLTQAEGVRDAVAAATDAQLRAALALRRGELRRACESIAHVVLAVLAEVEARVDFSEEVGDLDSEVSAAMLARAAEQLDAWLATASRGRLLRRGVRVAIVGPPNAGKSSLFNALVGRDRAIVTDQPGTTRDTVEESVELAGVPCVLVDTAGLRDAYEEPERIGIERSRAATESADHVLYVYDADARWGDDDERSLRAVARPTSVVANKADLQPCPTHGIPVSALAGTGLQALLDTLAQAVLGAPMDGSPAIDERHESALREAREALAEASATLRTDAPIDLACVHLRTALHALGSVTGATASADVVDALFSRFCLGK